MEHLFTPKIKELLKKYFSEDSEKIFEKSYLIQYLNLKTRSAAKGSKSRSSFANLYAIFVVLEDYVKKGYIENRNYMDYEGALYSNLLSRQRELLFGEKLQNHSLNNRLNSEFQKYFHMTNQVPIMRNLETSRYWINENLLIIDIDGKKINVAEVVLEIILEYSKTKQNAFDLFVKNCEELQKIKEQDSEKIKNFILELLAPKSDARLFEIVSYSILKYHYIDQKIYWGFSIESINQENLKLFKTGRTNANDGGIDFVMKPLGRFFQVTETLDFKKYFLDIDKIQKYPITFVIKSNQPINVLKKQIEQNAEKIYPVRSILNKYLECIEEIINIPILTDFFIKAIEKDLINDILNEIVNQSKLEFNYNFE